MKVGIAYGTKRKEATVQIAEWMKSALEEQGAQVVAALASEFGDFDCDGYIIGGSVYAFSARRTGITSFITSHRKKLTDKPVSLFIVCGSDPLPKRSEETGSFPGKQLKRIFLNPERYMRSLSRALASAPHTLGVFKGYQEEKDKAASGFMKQEEKVRRWALEAWRGFVS
jgi:menaquinone-dependent protoporphyrinogen IX oxidase